MADWSCGVPNELLCSIFQSLCFLDYRRCHAVCANWNFVAKTCRFRHSRQSPWLMLPRSKSDNQDGTCCFYDLANRLEFKIPLPPSTPNWRHCVGSSHGWLFIVDDLCELSMLNPLTGACFPLPSITTFPDVEAVLEPSSSRILSYRFSYAPMDKYDEYKLEEVVEYNYYERATVGWTSDSSYVVMVVHSIYEGISYARSTDTSWHPMETKTRDFEYIAFHDNLFYGISHTQHNGLLEIFEPSYNPPTMIKRITLSTPPQRVLSLYPECAFKRYVANLFGELFQVDRVFCWKYMGHEYRTCAFEVYKLDNDQQTWLNVKSIGDYSFFVGDNDVIVISAIDFPSIKGNCIYYTDDYHAGVYCHQETSRDLGVFSLEDGKITSYYDKSSELTYPAPIWTVPEL
ncbi:F-box protein [Canna indica]|uniref:F-box protein n=1 Tax=Canna indica TaxID=4628 RepID=A0AAQ3JVS3_9LILI|nr:F-box protein [Canna indica]